jgi:hypothetical protein
MLKYIKITNPVALTLMVLLPAIICMLVLTPLTDRIISWRVVTVSMLFFSIANHVVGLFVPRWGRYVFISFLCFGVIVVLLLTLAKQISGIGLGDLYSFQKTCTLLIMFYVLLTGLAGLFRTARLLIGDE